MRTRTGFELTFFIVIGATPKKLLKVAHTMPFDGLIRQKCFKDWSHFHLLRLKKQLMGKSYRS
jgi:hypothetical protein